MSHRVLLVGASLCVVAGALGAAAWSDATVGRTGLVAQPPTPELIARGAYLAQVGDCAACHSVPGRPAFSGGLKMAIPIGAIYSSNITPDDAQGIGRSSLEAFDRAVRYGVAGGHALYPAMPFPSYALTTSADIQALYAYFKQGVAPANLPLPANEVPFPLSMRWPLTFWRWAFAPKPTTAATEMDRGAYLVEGLGHCGDCHTPRAATLQVEAQNAGDGPAFLSGATVEAWRAPSLRNGGPDSIGSWSEAEIAQFLTTGSNAHGIAFGSMSDVITHSTQFLAPSDASAVARFLKTLHADAGAPATYDPATHDALHAGDASQRGAQVYLDNCAACHRPDGKGYQGVFPALFGNPVVNDPDPLSLIHIVLQGSTTPRTGSTPAQFTMPGFDWRLSDQEVADVVSFIRTGWGNRGTPVDAGTVGTVRRKHPG